MKFIVLYEQNQQFLRTYYPKSLQKIIEMQKAATQSAKLMSWAQAYKPLINHPGLNTYLKAFAAIDRPKSKPDVEESRSSTELLETDIDFVEFAGKNEERKVILHEAQSLKKIIIDIYKDNSKLLLLAPRKFEEITAELLFAQGFEVELTKRTRDGGYDIVAIQKVRNHFPLKFLVECKHYQNQKVSIEIIRSFKNVIDEQNANRGIIATTSFFSKDAIKMREQYPYLLDFRDKDALLEWVADYCIIKMNESNLS